MVFLQGGILTGRIFDAVREIKDDKRMAARLRVQAKYYPRWMEITAQETGEPCDSPEKIDFSIPQISLESLLCDPKYALHLSKPEVLEEFLSQLTDEEKELFWRRGEDGASYSDLTHVSIKQEVGNYIRNRRKKRNLSGWE